MRNIKRKIKSLINKFEMGQISTEDALSQINELAQTKISHYELVSYSGYTDQDSFVDQITQKPLLNWQDIGDEEAIDLIEEILLNTDNDALLDRNSEALEKRYRKPTGKVRNYIFHEAILTSGDILAELKKDTVFYI
ncbi:hypothetical protein [Spirosoma panaciterrae]|uniref:hypothetical protein n=1 Tax=Spirosoma panaciterrae TaxID=496058 RepID=UPI00036B268B|nr:hypothetical protein [Spirosoma panaciterrae]